MNKLSNIIAFVSTQLNNVTDENIRNIKEQIKSWTIQPITCTFVSMYKRNQITIEELSVIDNNADYFMNVYHTTGVTALRILTEVRKIS